MTSVFVLHHTYGNSESETYKLLGVFSSDASAQSAILKYLRLPGFIDYPDGFEVTEYLIDEAQWIEGFGFDLLDDVEE
ncbi:DUF7336 domain-containing protein [Dyella mobilis]|uniref:DUF7336 domain-containing protein n=1 Tax=Dyella mobilis TaxID=1849582 RepID=A0ABS2KFM7_9GAMM|nr:hypothetical protein [Dyella mobilis]MBM7129975.1 hypothetical protein [Dyella mobilis]